MAEKKTHSTSSGQASNVDTLVDQIGELSVLELSDLVSKLQEKLGVSAMAPVAVPAAGAATSGGEEAPAEAKSTATVILTDAGSNKIAVIKALREINNALGLKEAKDITEATPKEILSNAKMEEATAAKEKLEAAGAKVELK
ncbi:50S ribosomal protein L7/L12 [Candidatus Microgenomates bacterium]|nr:50S ribosomal protein L7/L12 [Candidatus Microgenomates bacterium]